MATRKDIYTWRGTDAELKKNFTGQNTKNIHPDCIYFALCTNPTTNELYYMQYIGYASGGSKRLIPVDPTIAGPKHLEMSIDDYNKLSVKDPNTFYYLT